jgi:hypothetical protein
LGWLWTEIFLSSASWATMITGINHLHPACHIFGTWIPFHSLLFFFFFGGPGIWSQVIANQAHCHFSHTYSPFCFGCFGEGASIFDQSGPKLWSSWSKPPKYLGLPAWTTNVLSYISILFM